MLHSAISSKPTHKSTKSPLQSASPQPTIKGRVSKRSIKRSIKSAHKLSRTFSTSATSAASAATSSTSLLPSDDFLAFSTSKGFHQSGLAQEYIPNDVESLWNDYWVDSTLFQPTLLRSKKFVMLLPPPNITGTLHLGHALTVAIQDTLTRYNRMSGVSTLWVPGVDHAGIATQVVVEKNIKKTTGKSRHDLGREKFIEQVWMWKEKYGDSIFSQLKKMGTSLDWSRTRFTLDQTCHDAVMEAFVQLYDSGTIYRDNRLVTWCCTLRSAISSIEIDSVDIDKPTMMKVPNYHKSVEVGVIHDFKYKIVSKQYANDVINGIIPQIDFESLNEIDIANSITVSTTRIETMLGDVAVAVHPDDIRYSKFKSGDFMLEHPLIPNYFIPIVFDDILVDPAFGTGAVKITPAHDPNDYQCAVRHKLPITLSLMNDDGDFAHPFFDKFNGKHRYDVREEVIAELTKKNSYGGKSANPMVISVCSRSGDIIEPMVKPQWWIASETMSLTGKTSADNKTLSFTPQASYGTWSQWLENHQDWCISRQLWWGHRIPAWYIHFDDESTDAGPHQEDPARWVIARSYEEAMEKVDGILKTRFSEKKLKKLTQDEDVLDTWFSSGLFPFSVMGWPHKGVKTDISNPHSKRNKDFLRFFPGTLLETGNDILFFWVARMVMLSQTLTGALPFNHVYLHTLIRDKLGRKMSKSLGNVIDPLDVINGIELEALHVKLLSSNLPHDEVEKATAQQKLDFPDGIPSCGSDALRFGLLSYTKQSGDINLDIQHIISSRQFHNKIWQAMRFAMMNIGDNADIFVPPIHGFNDIESVLLQQYQMLQAKHQKEHPNIPFDESLKNGTFEQQWILHRLATVVEQVNNNFDSYSLGEISLILQRFFTEDLCSRYLEISKSVVRKNTFKDGQTDSNQHYHPITANTQLNVLYYCIETFLKLLHPISPYLTDQLWFSLPGHKQRITSQSTSLHHDVIAPITTILNSIPADIIALSNADNTSATAQINSEIYHAISSLSQSQISKMKQFIDPEIFNLQSYHDRLTKVKQQNIPNEIKFQINPVEQMLSSDEIKQELVSISKRIQSGSISIQPFPSILQSIEQTQQFDTQTGQLTHVGTGLQSFQTNVAMATRMEKLMDVIERVRQVKARLQIPNHVKPQIVLEYISCDTETTSNDTIVSIDQLENEIITNLDAYQHIISILSFVSNPKTIQTTPSTSSVSATPSHDINNITHVNPNAKSYAIKQYISDRILVHIIVTPSNSHNSNSHSTKRLSTQAQTTEENSIDIDFSPELVKSERRYEYLTSFAKQLENNIEKTYTNPKVPEKIKIKNAADLASAMNEIIILKDNMQSLLQLVPKHLYIPTKIIDLKDQIVQLTKTKDKINTVIYGNVTRGKAAANEKHQKEFDEIVAEIGLLETQITELSNQ